jgi:hypothetical protein
MKNTFSFMIAIVFLVVAMNAFVLFLRLRKEHRPKIRRAAMEESEASKWRDKEIRRRLDREQDDAGRYVELRNKTLDLYDQVRKNAASGDVTV